MAFLSAYSSTTKVVLGDPERGYWVELKNCLSQGDKSEAENALTKGQYVAGDENVAVTVDVALYRQLMVLASVKAWNLDDESGAVWPVDLDHVQELPGPEFDRIWKVVDESNKPAAGDERTRFPAASVGGDQNGRARARKPR